MPDTAGVSFGAIGAIGAAEGTGGFSGGGEGGASCGAASGGEGGCGGGGWGVGTGAGRGRGRAESLAGGGFTARSSMGGGASTGSGATVGGGGGGGAANSIAISCGCGGRTRSGRWCINHAKAPWIAKAINTSASWVRSAKPRGSPQEGKKDIHAVDGAPGEVSGGAIAVLVAVEVIGLFLKRYRRISRASRWGRTRPCKSHAKWYVPFFQIKGVCIGAHVPDARQAPHSRTLLVRTNLSFMTVRRAEDAHAAGEAWRVASHRSVRPANQRSEKRRGRREGEARGFRSPSRSLCCCTDKRGRSAYRRIRSVRADPKA